MFSLLDFLLPGLEDQHKCVSNCVFREKVTRIIQKHNLLVFVGICHYNCRRIESISVKSSKKGKHIFSFRQASRAVILNLVNNI